jgi:alkanesulfonate monooxygenase SsuD/methylene tetrahydromethanopterin reductase-like flavin-dependent oxidoreductase (luciferase family)
LNGFDVAPTVQVFVTDDLAGARDAMRPFIALYVGDMGSREQNFYNRLVSSYGFEEAAQQVQDLYLEGRRSEAAMALPDELIDTVTIAGPRDKARERIRAFKDAGVETLIISPMALDNESRMQQLRIVAELAGEIA